MKHPRLPLAVGALVLIAAFDTLPLRAAETLTVEDTVPAIEAKDQHEKAFKLEDGVKWLLISFDMGTGKAANGWLAKQGAEFLSSKHAVFVSNIHGMPGVGRMFALPKMRKYPHRIILADTEGLLDAFPRKDGQVTVLKLKPGLVIESVSYWTPKDGKSPLE